MLACSSGCELTCLYPTGIGRKVFEGPESTARQRAIRIRPVSAPVSRQSTILKGGSVAPARIRVSSSGSHDRTEAVTLGIEVKMNQPHGAKNDRSSKASPARALSSISDSPGSFDQKLGVFGSPDLKRGPTEFLAELSPVRKAPPDSSVLGCEEERGGGVPPVGLGGKKDGVSFGRSSFDMGWEGAGQQEEGWEGLPGGGGAGDYDFVEVCSFVCERARASFLDISSTNLRIFSACVCWRACAYASISASSACAFGRCLIQLQPALSSLFPTFRHNKTLSARLPSPNEGNAIALKEALYFCVFW